MRKLLGVYRVIRLEDDRMIIYIHIRKGQLFREFLLPDIAEKDMGALPSAGFEFFRDLFKNSEVLKCDIRAFVFKI